MHSELSLADQSGPDLALHSQPALALQSEARALHSEPALALSEPALALRSLPDDELLSRLRELVSQSRRVEADLVAHIGEVEARGLFARQAFPSMFAYCTQALHLSEAEAYRRITVARATRKHPVLLEMLRDGRLHLSGMALLVPLLTPENRDTVLARAIHLSKREIEELVAEIAPRPDVPSVIRKLPDRRHGPMRQPSPTADQTQPSTSELFPGGVGEKTSPLPTTELFPGRVDAKAPPLPTTELFPGRVAAKGSTHPAAAGLPHPSAPGLTVPTSPGLTVASVDSPLPLRSQRPVIEPLAPARYKVQFTASAELRDKLERLAALMRSQVPNGDLAALIECAVTEKLERLEARRFASTATPRRTLSDTDTSPASRHIPAAVRRAVRERDQDRCRFVGDEGRRCSERHRLEFHHRRPFGMGGDHSAGNISLMCPAHNRHLAEIDYGQATIRRHVLGEMSSCEVPQRV